MLIIPGLTVLLLAVTALSRDSAVGRVLRRGLVEAPARALNRIRPGRVVFFALLAAFGIAMALLFQADGLRLFGFLLPDLMVWFAVFDVGVFIEALLIGGTVLAANGLGAARAGASALHRGIARLVTRRVARAPRTQRARSRPTGKTVDDDEPEWAHQVAGYRAFSMA